MNRNLDSVIGMTTAICIVAAAAAIVTCGRVYADDITVEQAGFVSTLSREEVNAELKKPYPAGNPWSSQYDMHPRQSTTTPEQATNEYLQSREAVRELTGEDSGSAYLLKGTPALAANPGATMGGSSR